MGTRTVRFSSLQVLDDAVGADPGPTPVERSYLKVIAYLATRRQPVIAAQIARWLKVRPPTVTHVLQRLEQKGLIQRDHSDGIALSASGRAIAEQVVRRHQLLERYLFDTLQIPWHEVHREATLLEPSLSPLLEARLVALVGDARTCPHGNPIPGQGHVPDDDQPLTAAPPGSWFVITRIDEEAGEDSCTLQVLWTRGLLPNTSLVRLPDLVGGVLIQRADRRCVLSRRVAGFLWGRTESPPVTLAATDSATELLD
jgi:DtxR family Mn-dependent transcriptional regulator